MEPKRKNEYVMAFLQYLRVERNYSERTQIIYGDALAQFESFVVSTTGSFDPLKPELDHVRAWMTSMAQRKLKVTTINQSLSALRSFYRYLRFKRLITVNPMTLLPTPRVPKQLPVWIPASQMDHLLDEVDMGDDFDGRQKHMLIELLYQTGMRRSEAANLKNSDIDFGRMVIRIFGKGSKEREVPFGPELKRELEDYMNFRDAEVGSTPEYLLTSRMGHRFTPSQVTAMAHQCLDNIPTLAKRGAHVLRHSFATNMLSQGADLVAVKELLGHASLGSTEVYTHLTPQELIESYRSAHPRAEESGKSSADPHTRKSGK